MRFDRPQATVDGWSPATRELLEASGSDLHGVAAVIDRALAEDFADGPDLTTLATVPAELVRTATITPRTAGVLAGGPVAAAVFDTVSAGALRTEILVPEGGRLLAGVPALRISGRVRDLLTAERTALNLLSHLSGIATTTAAWVDAVAGTGAVIRDSRKTLPGLRALQKDAVRRGGGSNHRLSLGDAALIKDNHVAAAGSVTAAVAAVRELAPDLPLEVEVDTLEQLDEALAAGVALIMLDNFDLAATAVAVQRVRAGYPGVRLEASGGLTVDRAAAVAATGVDFLAVGGLTHSSPALDLGLDL